jgi:hypothetical protein
MRIFLQANDHDMYMYAIFGDLTFYGFLYLNTPIFDLFEFSIRQ